VVFEGNRRSWHYYVIRHFDNLGWKLIENDFSDTLTSRAILKETFNVKMMLLEEKFESAHEIKPKTI
jgi:lipoprotein NlpI